MARGWPFVGGLMIVTTVTYINMTAITAIAKDIQTSLLREKRKLDEARNPQASTDSPPPSAGLLKWPSSTRVTDRIKKMWNEDIERSVRRMQKTDWERMEKEVEAHMKRARERMSTSFERMGQDSKKNST
jgi:Altered inheritance of mitochondria 5